MSFLPCSVVPKCYCNIWTEYTEWHAPHFAQNYFHEITEKPHKIRWDIKPRQVNKGRSCQKISDSQGVIEENVNLVSQCWHRVKDSVLLMFRKSCLIVKAKFSIHSTRARCQNHKPTNPMSVPDCQIYWTTRAPVNKGRLTSTLLSECWNSGFVFNYNYMIWAQICCLLSQHAKLHTLLQIWKKNKEVRNVLDRNWFVVDGLPRQPTGKVLEWCAAACGGV
jgi:hypothetical protein